MLHRQTEASSWLAFAISALPLGSLVFSFALPRLQKARALLGSSSNRLVVISDGSVVVAFVSISIAPAPKGETAFGIEPDRLGKIGDGLVIVAFVRISDAPGPQGETALWIEFESLG